MTVAGAGVGIAGAGGGVVSAGGGVGIAGTDEDVLVLACALSISSLALSSLRLASAVNFSRLVAEPELAMFS